MILTDDIIRLTVIFWVVSIPLMHPAVLEKVREWVDRIKEVLQ